MRFLVYFSLLCVLLLCFSVFSIEGKKRPAKPWKDKPCCPQASTLRGQKGRHIKNCRRCKSKPELRFWIVPGALPQV
uniref:Colon-derived SUSD2 binding factor n=1 Tax=Rousettus aegyptiacus TaxID=9407 RepID=A0A7J8G4B2_ROUAE|nr:colon-derived SUSD2 binding factor [Rousettus aegyptiacus]